MWQNHLEQQHQFGGGGASEPTSQQKRNDRLQERLLRKQLRASENPVEMPTLEIPESEPIAPPPTTSSRDVEAEADEVRRAARRRKGILKSRIAGETGGGVKRLAAPRQV